MSQDTLFHATYAPLLPSIIEYGLGGQGARPNWPDSAQGMVYLALSKEIAISYAETPDEVPEDWLDQIVLIGIDRVSLDADFLEADANVQGDPMTLQYLGVIPFSACRVIQGHVERPAVEPGTERRL